MKWNENELVQVVALADEGKTNEQIAQTVGRTTRSVERRLSKAGYVRKKHEKENVSCTECGEIIEGFGEAFCSRSCAASHTNKRRDKKVYEQLSSTLREQYVEDKSHPFKRRAQHARDKRQFEFENAIVSNKERPKKERVRKGRLRKEWYTRVCKCVHCKDSFINDTKIKVCLECTQWTKNVPMYKLLGCYGTGVKLQECNRKALVILSDLYFNKKYSKPEIKQLVGVDTNSLFRYFKKNDINLRNGSEALSNAFETGRSKLPQGHPHYKCGWHTSWQGRAFYYRSSYELKYCLFLDEKRVPYEMEFRKFLYYDTQEKKNRFAIPDFYLPLENRIVEIKGAWTYDAIEMEDKSKVYVEAGYNFTLLREEELKSLGIKL